MVQADATAASGRSGVPALPTRDAGHVESLRKASVWLARDLANYISDNHFSEGTRLPNEQEMAQTFGVGRTTVREALRILEMRGVITIRVGRGGGPVVRRPKTTDLAEALGLVLQFRDATLADIIDARLLIEPIAAKVAAERVTDTTLAELRHTVDTMMADPEDLRRFSEQNAHFHSLISESLGNPVISILVDSLKSVHDGRPFGIRYTPKHVRAIATSHLGIVEALEKSDGSAAEEAMREHLEEARRYWARRFTDAYRRPLRWLHGD